MKDMMWIVLSSCLLFTMFIGHGWACETGVFGLDCTNQCHCRRGDCTVSGYCCRTYGCKDGWGGIHCNYRDVAFDKSSPLTDNNEKTCLDSSPNRLNYNFTMREETKLTWVRFNLKKQDVFEDAKISFEDSSGKTIIPISLRKIVAGYTVDLIGSLDKKFKFIKIAFKSARNLLNFKRDASKRYFCGMFVSGGRNVAIKQPVISESVWEDNVAERAVDGVRDADFNNGHCTATEDETTAWLELKPRLPIDVNYIEIYNSDVLSCRLKYFRLWLAIKYWDSVVEHHYDIQRETQMVYKVPVSTFEPVGWILIEVNHDYWRIHEDRRTCGDSPHYNVLAVCELEVYGEVICPARRFGYDCEKSCDYNCVSGCHVETGYCFECEAGRSGGYCEIVAESYKPSIAWTIEKTCEPGVFGLNCTNQCHCRSGGCTALGRCILNTGCEDGWGGIHCSYRDAAFNKTSPLTDNDIDTCLDSSLSASYIFSMTEETKLTWIRFNLKKLNVFDNDEDVEISFGDSSNETVIPTFLRKIIDEFTVDFIGSMERKFKYIRLDFKSLENKQYFCGMFVSGGRNVAFKQPVEFINGRTDNVADTVVDGVRDPSLWSRHCVVTAGDEDEWLSMTPRLPIDVNYIEIYNTNFEPCELSVFYRVTLRTFGYNLYSTVEAHPYTILWPAKVYKELARTFEPIHQIWLNVSRSTDDSYHCRNKHDRPMIYVCELEVYGEVRCPAGRYGYDCEKRCDSKCVSGCHVETGFCNKCAQGRIGKHCEIIALGVRVCEPGVFGLNCTYQCHCRGEKCTALGECILNTGCEDGWGGIHCSYHDAAFKMDDPLTDNSLETCLTDLPYDEVFWMREETKLTWIRFNLKKRNVIDEVEIRFYDSSYTLLIPTFLRKIDNGYIVDFIGSMDRKFNYIILVFKHWGNKPYFCGMFVSGGRNVAFKQPVYLSSVWEGHVADRAVDGVRDAKLDKNHCASTLAKDHTWLSLEPRLPIDVNFVEIYNSDLLQCRSTYLNLRLLSGIGLYSFLTLQNHTDNITEPHMVYKVLAKTFEPVRRIYLEVNSSPDNFKLIGCGNSPHPNRLTVCELEVYGEVICPGRQYGYDCEKRCDSKCLWGCHVETGFCNECPQGRIGKHCEIIERKRKACEPGVFGLYCSNQCHCRLGDCTELGKCTYHVCKDGWGGIHCVYRDAAFNTASPLTDNDHTTCMDSNRSKSHYRFTMREETKLTLIRFNLKKPNVFDNDEDVEISFEDSSNKTVYPYVLRKIVDGYTVDVVGRMDKKFKYIKLVFKSLDNKQYFCGMFVSGGRNVAFKQPVSLSSVWKGHDAERAVDGDRDNNCASTEAKDLAWFQLEPFIPIDVNFVKIYNADFKSCALKYLSLMFLSGPQNSLAQNHSDPKYDPQKVYKVLAETFKPISTILILVDKNIWRPMYHYDCDKTLLTVCELEVYGDVICTVGRFGYDCEKTCHVNCVHGCDVETGYCLKCVLGTTGKHCEIGNPELAVTG